jgi:hypothetical protein
MDYVVSLYSLADCKTGSCLKKTQFSMDSNGFTQVQGESELIPFSQRVSAFLNTEPKTPLGENKFDNKFKIFKMDDSYGILNQYKESIVGKTDDITSPAFYRATLLAAGANETSVATLFCNDTWNGIMTDTVPYSLLQSLYYDMDQDGGRISPALSAELEQTVSQFLGNNVAKQVDSAAADFSHLAFIDPKEIASGFCKVSGVISTNLPQQKNILTSAHRELRNMYDAHLGNVIRFIRKILTLKEVGFGKPVSIRINPVFVTNPTGADVALERLMREARTLLSNHYLQVELTYKKAITDIAALSEGALPASAVNPPVPASNRVNVAKPTETRNVLARGIRGAQNSNSVN